MGIMAIACYRAKPGFERKMLAAVKQNTPLLASRGLITDRPVIIMKSENGTLLEIFEWVSKSAKAKAHTTTEVMALWNQMMQLGKNVKLASVPEANDVFANFRPV